MVLICSTQDRIDQRELSDRWQEALTIRSWVEEIWQELEQEGDSILGTGNLAGA